MLRKIVRALPVLMLLLAPVAAKAQDRAVVTGRVTDASGRPEGGVHVDIRELRVGAVTGSNGEYRLFIPAERVPRGVVSIVVSRTGFASQTRAVQVAVGRPQTQNFQLSGRASMEGPGAVNRAVPPATGTGTGNRAVPPVPGIRPY